MPTPTKGARMGGGPAHQKRMLANLAAALFEHGKITTTEARARRLRPYAEKVITLAKRDDVNARREVFRRLPPRPYEPVPTKDRFYNLFTEIAPSFADRPGGYTRITKLGPRKGDAAPMAVIELVTEEVSAKPARRRRRAAASGGGRKTSSAAAATAEETAQAQAADAEAAEAEADEAETAEEDEAETAEAEAETVEAAEAETVEAAEAPEAEADEDAADEDADTTVVAAEADDADEDDAKA